MKSNKIKIFSICLICLFLFILLCSCSNIESSRYNPDVGREKFKMGIGDKQIYIYHIKNSIGVDDSFNLFYCRQVIIRDKNDNNVSTKFELYADSNGIFATKLVEYNKYFIVTGYEKYGNDLYIIDHYGWNLHHENSTYPTYETKIKNVKFQKDEYTYKYEYY